MPDPIDEFIRQALERRNQQATPTPAPRELEGYSATELRQLWRAGRIDEGQWTAELRARGSSEQQARDEIARQKNVGVSTAASTRGQLTASEQAAVNALKASAPPPTPTPAPAQAAAAAPAAAASQGGSAPFSPANPFALRSVEDYRPDVPLASRLPATATGGTAAGNVGPGGRTFEQVTGTEYLSDAERQWYLAEAQRRGSAGTRPATTARASSGSQAAPKSDKTAPAAAPAGQPAQPTLGDLLGDRFFNPETATVGAASSPEARYIPSYVSDEQALQYGQTGQASIPRTGQLDAAGKELPPLQVRNGVTIDPTMLGNRGYAAATLGFDPGLFAPELVAERFAALGLGRPAASLFTSNNVLDTSARGTSANRGEAMAAAARAFEAPPGEDFYQNQGGMNMAGGRTLGEMMGNGAGFTTPEEILMVGARTGKTYAMAGENPRSPLVGPPRPERIEVTPMMANGGSATAGYGDENQRSVVDLLNAAAPANGTTQQPEVVTPGPNPLLPSGNTMDPTTGEMQDNRVAGIVPRTSGSDWLGQHQTMWGTFNLVRTPDGLRYQESGSGRIMPAGFNPYQVTPNYDAIPRGQAGLARQLGLQRYPREWLQSPYDDPFVGRSQLQAEGGMNYAGSGAGMMAQQPRAPTEFAMALEFLNRVMRPNRGRQKEMAPLPAGALSGLVA